MYVRGHRNNWKGVYWKILEKYMEKKIPLVSFGPSSIALLAFAGRVEGTLQ